MSGKKFRLHILRTVRQSLGRFLAIFGIVMLGVGFMAGMLSVAPDMRLSADTYLDNSNFYDIRVIGTLGITAEDIVAMRKTEGVRGVMPCYTSDAIVSGDTGLTKVARISTLPFSLPYKENESYINQIELLSGRMPEKAGEAVFVTKRMQLDTYKIGDTVTFTEDNRELSDTFAVNSFTIVGVVQSPAYFSIDKETTDTGAGTVEANLYVTEDSFCMETYTDAYITVKDANKLNSFHKEYENTVSEIADEISEISNLRCEIRKTEVSEQLASAKRELTQNKKELYAAKGELDLAKSQINMLESNIPTIEAMLNDGKKQYEDGLELYEEEIGKAQEQLETAETAINAMNAVIAVADGMIEDAKAELEAMRDEGNTAMADVLQAQLDNLLEYYDGLMAEYDELVKQYEDGLEMYETAKAEADKMLAEAETMISDYEKQLNDAKEQLKTAKAEYAAGKAEYDKQSAEAEIQFAQAEKKIEETEKLLETVGTPEWYVVERSKETAFSGFADNTDRIEAIATVFPVFFFLVAALVATTTMTRMIDEERTQIGTLKALGYSKNAIAAKYVIYSEAATVAGSIIGIIIGTALLPSILWDTYGMMYSLGEVITPFYPLYCLIAAGVAMLVTFIATVMATRHALSEVPATLMLPKAPKAGKKILLERIGFIWKPMPFIQKVTARNLFRYKKRFLMTVLGIAGCTALLLTGFGLRDSISDIVNKQFGQIHRYDTMVALKNSDGLEELKEYLNGSVKKYSLSYQASVITEANGKTHNDNIFIAESGEKLSEFITLRERVSKKSITLDDSGVVITEKTAKELNIKTGDSVTVTLDGVFAELTVTGIAENYVYGYVYITEKLYIEKFGEAPEYNLINLMLNSEADRKAVSTAILQNDSVAQVSSISDMKDSLNNMLDKVNMVVWVLIVSAGLLAFVVLYNLINININERRREIATLKVLGFRKGETFAYIFRETAILTVIGTAVGLALGILLWAFVVKTAEVDMVMFGREIKFFSFIISAVMTFVFSGIVFFFMTPKLNKIDMVESLKSGE